MQSSQLGGILRFLWILFLVGSSLASAQNPTPITIDPYLENDPAFAELGALETTVITASRREESAFETPFQVEHLDAETLRNRLVRTLPEALAETPGVVVQKTAHGHGSPYIRGWTAYHNLLLIDGIRLNNAAFRGGPNQYWSTVDVYGLSAIELVKSQGSVLYGADAVGGTLQALTLRPSYAETGFLASGRSFSRYSSGDRSFVQRAEGSISEAGKYGLIVGGNYKDFGNIDAAGLGRLPFTGYDEWDMDAKLEVFLGDTTRLTLFHHQVNQDDLWRVHKTVHAKSWAGTDVGSEQARIFDQSRMLSYAQLAGEVAGPLFDEYTVSFSHQLHDEDRFRERGDGRQDYQGFDLHSYGVWAQFDKALELTDLTYGFDYYQDRADSYRNDYNADGSFKGSKIQGPIGDDATYHLADIFLNSSTPIGGRLTLDLGARYTYAEADIGKVEDPNTGSQISINDNWDTLVGSARFSYQLDEADQLRLFGGVSQAFRAPNFSDLSRLDSNRSNEIETPAPGLGPEEFVTFELGIKAEVDRLSGSLSYFYTDVNDLILRTPTGRSIDGLEEVTKSNVGDGHVQGVELNAAYDLDHGFSLFGGFGWQDSKVSTFPTSEPITADEPLSRLMPLNGFGGVRWESTNERFWIEGLVTGFASGDRLSTRDTRDTQRIPPGGTPSYWLATLRSGYDITDQFTLNAALENIFDEEYRAHGSGQNESGTSFIISAELRF